MSSELNNFSDSSKSYNNQPKYQHVSESSGKASQQAQKDEANTIIINGNSSFNNGQAISEENNSQKSQHSQEEKQKYDQNIENEKNNFGLKPQDEKASYLKECDEYLLKLQELQGLFKESVLNKEGLINMVEKPKDILSKWGPKRCLIYLKLASLYGLAENWEEQNLLIKTARRDLNLINDAEDKPEISEYRRWLQLQRIENRLNDKKTKVEDLNRIGILFEKCWNVRQRHFEGRRDFLDFYTLFFAKYLLRKGEYTKAGRFYKDALILRRQREAFWNQDDFDWKKLKEEVEKEIGENIK